MKIDGKEIDEGTVVIDGVDTRDYPDFSDAYVGEAFFTDGEKLTEEQLEAVQENHADWVYELLIEHLY